MSRRRCVLDASAVLALVRREPGAKAVESHLETAAISAVNWCEVAEHAGAHGIDAAALRSYLAEAGLEVTAFEAEQAEEAARLRPPTRSVGLGLADRACLALARRLDVPTVTADRTWAALDLGVEIVMIR